MGATLFEGWIVGGPLNGVGTGAKAPCGRELDSAVARVSVEKYELDPLLASSLGAAGVANGAAEGRLPSLGGARRRKSIASFDQRSKGNWVRRLLAAC